MLNINCDFIQYKYIYTNNTSPSAIKTKRYISIYIDKSFNTSDKIAIDNAINQWNYALNQQIILKVVSYEFDMEPELIKKAQIEQGWLFLKVDSDNSTIPDNIPYEQCKLISTCDWTLAWTDREGGWIMKVIRDRINANNVETVVLHEIGHLLSLPHNKTDKNSLMYDNYGRMRYLCIDQDSVYKVAKIYGLDKNTMNYCLQRY